MQLYFTVMYTTSFSINYTSLWDEAAKLSSKFFICQYLKSKNCGFGPAFHIHFNYEHSQVLKTIKSMKFLLYLYTSQMRRDQAEWVWSR